MTIRRYSSTSQETSLVSSLSTTATTMVVNSALVLGGTTLNAGERLTLVLDPDTALEEIVYAIAPSNPTSTTITIIRGVDGTGVEGVSGIAHSAGAKVRHMAIGVDFREANDHIESLRSTVGATAHGIPLATIILNTDIGTVSNGMIANNGVTTSKIADLNVTTIKIADSAITSGKIADLTIATGDIADAAITSGKIATGAVGTIKIDDLSVTESKIAPNAITSAKIADGTIVAGDIADGAITSGKILDGTIVNADVNSSAQIAYSKLTLTNTITNADISAAAGIAMSKLAVDPTARANHTGTQLASTISNFDTQVRTSKVTDLAAPITSVSVNSQKITDLATPTLATDAATKAYADLMIPLTQKGAANGVAELDATGKIPFDHIPASVIANTFVVSSQAAMLALAAGVGDIAVRTDLNKSFILQTTPATTLGNWIELLTPLDAVTSVDGLVGVVNLSSTYATVANAANKLPLAGGTMSGPIAMGTNKITGLGDPTTAQDAATKNYIDTVVLAPSNLVGPITSVGNITSIASQTGTGTKFVVDTSPTLVTPELGAATATSINGTPIPTSKTLVATDSTVYVVPPQASNSGKVLTTNGTTSSWSTTINGTAIPATKTLVVTTDKLSALAATTSAELASVLTDETGTGSSVFATSPTLVTPILGTPTSATLTNATGLPISTGVSGLGANVATFLATPSSANLLSAMTTETGTGNLVFGTSPSLTTPKITLSYAAKTAAYQFGPGDEGNIFSMNNAATQQFNIPTDAVLSFSIGTQFNVFWITGAGQPTIGAVTPGTTTVISTAAVPATPKLRVVNSMATVMKIAVNSWIVIGDIA